MVWQADRPTTKCDRRPHGFVAISFLTISVTLWHKECQGVRYRRNGGRQDADGLTVDLDVNARGVAIVGGIDLDVRGARNGNPICAVQAVCHDGPEEAKVVLPLAILENDDFKIVVGQTDAAGNLEIAAVVSYASDQGEAGAILRAVGRQMEARHGAAQLPEAAMPVGQLAEFAFEMEVELVDDARVQTNACHENEMAARLVRPFERPQRDADGRGIEKLFRGAIGPVGETDFVGQNVGGAGGQDAEPNLGAGYSIDDLVDGAVAAGGEDEIAARVDRFAGKLSGRLRTRRGNEVDVRSGGISEDTNGDIQTRASGPFQTTGKRIVNDSDTMGL